MVTRPAYSSLYTQVVTLYMFHCTYNTPQTKHMKINRTVRMHVYTHTHTHTHTDTHTLTHKHTHKHTHTHTHMYVCMPILQVSYNTFQMAGKACCGVVSLIPLMSTNLKSLTTPSFLDSSRLRITSCTVAVFPVPGTPLMYKHLYIMGYELVVHKTGPE